MSVEHGNAMQYAYNPTTQMSIQRNIYVYVYNNQARPAAVAFATLNPPSLSPFTHNPIFTIRALVSIPISTIRSVVVQ
jgi:hypothetical protein